MAKSDRNTTRKATPRAGHPARGAAKRQRQDRRTAEAVAFGLCLLVILAVVKLGTVIRGDIEASRQPGAQPLITLAPQAIETPAPTPTPSPEPTATPEPQGFADLPVIRDVDTQEKMIAVTVDDCYQVDNLRTIVRLAEDNGGRLTIFPVGENLDKSGMPELLRHAVFDLGFEVENHTWSHARIFRLPEGEMAEEIWKQGAALNRALGVNYRMHFFRLMGGDGETDQRTHNYLAQLGYLGIADWSVSGSDSSLKHIRRSLSPGQVYLFHCTDSDTKKLKDFIPYAVSEGYRLVTLNELLGIEPNAMEPLTEEAMPLPRAYDCDFRPVGRGEYTWITVRLQDALREKGYLKMKGQSTGYFGPDTESAVKKWQADHGLPATGIADEATQRSILEINP